MEVGSDGRPSSFVHSKGFSRHPLVEEAETVRRESDRTGSERPYRSIVQTENRGFGGRPGDIGSPTRRGDSGVPGSTVLGQSYTGRPGAPSPPPLPRCVRRWFEVSVPGRVTPKCRVTGSRRCRLECPPTLLESKEYTDLPPPVLT